MPALIEEWATLRRRLVDGERKLAGLTPNDPRFVAGFRLWAELEARYRAVVLELADAGIGELALLADLERAA